MYPTIHFPPLIQVCGNNIGKASALRHSLSHTASSFPEEEEVFPGQVRYVTSPGLQAASDAWSPPGCKSPSSCGYTWETVASNRVNLEVTFWSQSHSRQWEVSLSSWRRFRGIAFKWCSDKQRQSRCSELQGKATCHPTKKLNLLKLCIILRLANQMHACWHSWYSEWSSHQKEKSVS